MTQIYNYFAFNSNAAIIDGKERGLTYIQPCFEDKINNESRDISIETFIDPTTKTECTRLVQKNAKGKIVTTNLVNFIEHPTKTEIAFLKSDSNATNANFTLNNDEYSGHSQQLEWDFTQKTKEELEILGFVFYTEAV